MFIKRFFSLFILFFLFACVNEKDFPLGAEEQSPQPIVLNFSSSASKIGLGATDIELSWVADNANSCGAYGDWSGWVPVSGNASITPTSTGQKVFSLHCINERYVQTASVVVEIDNPPSISAAGLYVVDENSSFVGTFSGTDPDNDPLVADIFGDDAELFEIVLNDQNTFDIFFKDAPDYEKPNDSNSDNSYEVRLSVYDGTTGSNAETIINVQDVAAYTLVGENLIEFPANSSGTQDAHAVSKDGSHIAVIGYDFSEGEAVGVNARLFKLNESNNSWALIETFELNSQPFSQALGVVSFGVIRNSVDFIETDNVFGLVFGVPFCIHVDSGLTNGCVYTYFLSQDGVWGEEAVIFDEDDISDNFGFSVDVSSDGSLLAVGAPSPERNGGAVHTFELEGKGIGPKTYRFESDSYFGADVSLSGSGAKLAVGAPGGYFQPLSDSPGTVTIIHIPTGLDFVISVSGDYPGNNFGNEVSLSGDGSKVAVGASTTQTPEEVRVYGAAYVFNANTGEQIGNMLVSPFEDSGWFGHGLDISSDGRFLAVGSPPGNHPYGAAPGHTMLYKYMENEGWVLYKDFYPTNENFGYYGWDVEFSSDNKRLSITSTDFYSGIDATGYIEVYDISEAGILLSDAILNPEPVVSKIPKTERFGNIFQQIKK